MPAAEPTQGTPPAQLAPATGGVGGASMGTGGAAAGGVGGGGARGDVGAGDGGGEEPPAATCSEAPIARAAGAGIELAVELRLAGKVARFGEPNPLPGGGTLTPTNLRFYLSDPALLLDDGRVLPVDIVDEGNGPVPYNVHMVSFEDARSLRVRVAAPAGAYAGLRFLFGLNDTCNGSDPARRKSPLNPASQMTWPHPGLGLGYLFLRHESQLTGAGTGAPPDVIHMGGLVNRRFAPVVTLAAKLQATAGRQRYQLVVSLDEMFKAADLPADLEGFFGPPGPETRAGEHLRQNVGKVTIFSISP